MRRSRVLSESQSVRSRVFDGSPLTEGRCGEEKIWLRLEAFRSKSSDVTRVKVVVLRQRLEAEMGDGQDETMANGWC